jgi:hypothetical protein
LPLQTKSVITPAALPISGIHDQPAAFSDITFQGEL